MRNQQQAFKVYPRGFLGAHLQTRVQKEERYQENNRGFIPVKVSSLKQANGVNDYNHAIEELWSAYVREEPGVTGIDFRERVFKAAFASFGTPSFNVWFLAQLQSPFVGSLQRDFLDDCLNFLVTGRRKMYLENWAALLVIDNADEGSMKPSKAASDFFGLNQGPAPYSGYTTADMIQAWCSKPNGFEDLLGTLHILFGNT